MTSATWTPARIDDLKGHYLQGLSAAQIASCLGEGVTRNAVIGKVHRMVRAGQLEPRQQISRPPLVRARKERQERPRRRSADPVARPALAPVLARPKTKEEPLLAEPTATHVSVMDIRPNQCRFPHGDPKSSDFRFCGAEVWRFGSAWCRTHRAVVYQPAAPREKAA